MKEKVVLLRNIFYKCFAVSFIYYMLITAFYLIKMDWFVDIMNNYYKIGPHDTQVLCGYYLGLVEIITFNFLLVPAIGLHWASNSIKSK